MGFDLLQSAVNYLSGLCFARCLQENIFYEEGGNTWNQKNGKTYL